MLGHLLAALGVEGALDALRRYRVWRSSVNVLKSLLRSAPVTILVPSIQQSDFFIPTVAKRSPIPTNVPLLPFPEAIAISKLFGVLARRLKPENVRLLPAAAEVTDGHLIAIGGPSVNAATHRLLETHRLSKSLSIVYPDHYVNDSTLNRQYRVDLVNGNISNDYGFLVVGRNPFSPMHVAIVCMGVWAHGTNAAVQCLLSISAVAERKDSNGVAVRQHLKNLQRGGNQAVTVISESKALGLSTGIPAILDVRIE